MSKAHKLEVALDCIEILAILYSGKIDFEDIFFGENAFEENTFKEFAFGGNTSSIKHNISNKFQKHFLPLRANSWVDL